MSEKNIILAPVLTTLFFVPVSNSVDPQKEILGRIFCSDKICYKSDYCLCVTITSIRFSYIITEKFLQSIERSVQTPEHALLSYHPHSEAKVFDYSYKLFA